MKQLEGKVAWITGAGSGIGEAAAIALAGEGASVVLTGRTLSKLEAVAGRIGAAATIEAGDLTRSDQVIAIAGRIVAKFGRLDILVANAGTNIVERAWSQLTPAGADKLIQGNLTSVFYCLTTVLPTMRAQRDGVVIITASMAGRFIGALSGPGYVAAKHGVVALSHTVNMEECVNGIRCTAVLPGEVATPLLDKRPVAVSPEERARMAQPEDLGDLIRYVACLPKRVVINEVMMCPTWNRGYVAALGRKL
ncbi:MAG: SDR family oxidoreductase [Devosia sp.]|nr:SDR family oxidoreductase [Devosia sp.]